VHDIRCCTAYLSLASAVTTSNGRECVLLPTARTASDQLCKVVPGTTFPWQHLNESRDFVVPKTLAAMVVKMRGVKARRVPRATRTIPA
jgi:hypothetical protein